MAQCWYVLMLVCRHVSNHFSSLLSQCIGLKQVQSTSGLSAATKADLMGANNSAYMSLLAENMLLTSRIDAQQ